MPISRLKNTAAAPAETLETCPDRPNDELWREMGVLRAAGERGVIGFPDGVLKRRADLIPALAEIDLAGPTKNAVRKIRCAESGEADQLLLLRARGGTLRRFDFGREPDRGDIVTRTSLPALRQDTITDDMEVLASRAAPR